MIYFAILESQMANEKTFKLVKMYYYQYLKEDVVIVLDFECIPVIMGRWLESHTARGIGFTFIHILTS